MIRRNDSTLGERILNLLKGSEWWTNSTTKVSGNTIQGLTCPVCGEKGVAWAYLNGPMAINCNRLSQCGARTKTLELFPELKKNFDTDFKPTKADPHRPAREYLLSRGLPEALLKGLGFWYLSSSKPNSGSGGVAFNLGKDVTGKDLWNARLFSPNPGEGKTRNTKGASTSGVFWRHHAFTYDPIEAVWITEGIIDALSLLAMDRQAIAVLAAGQNPFKIDLTEFPHKILAFDNDDAGRAACRRWNKAYPEAEVVLCDQERDWNDLLTSSTSPEQAAKQLVEALPRFRTNGKLAMANSAQEWADIFHQFHQHPPELFDFSQETYFAQLKIPRGSDLPPYLDTRRILRASIKVISYLIDSANPSRPEFRYHLEVTPSQKGRRPIEATATGRDLSTARSLNEFFLSFARVNLEGDHRAASAIQSKITSAKSPEVQQLTVIGYQPENGAYVFPRWGVDTGGQLLQTDKRGHFRIGHNRFFRPPAYGEVKSINPESITKKQVQNVFHGILDAWGLNGVAVFSWAVAGWFVNQVKEEEGFFPFISLWGDPAAGKSALVVLLNNIQGREGEGLPISQLNSKKGMVRTIGQVSGMYTALLEDNERNENGFDYSMLLTGFNRGPLQVHAAFSSDLQTKESPFLGTLMFVQNVEPFSSKAERQRVISLQFKAEGLTDASRAAYEKLMGTGRGILAGVMKQVLLNRSHFEESWQKEYRAAQADIAPMSERRILDNHALILAFYRLFCSCFNIRSDQAFTAFMKEIGKRKCISASTRQTTIADTFFEYIDAFIDEEKVTTAYHIDPEKGWLLVNLPKVESILRSKGLNFQASEHLNIALQHHPSFIRNGFGYRFPNDPATDSSGRTKKRKTWVFDLEWHKNNQLSSKEA